MDYQNKSQKKDNRKPKIISVTLVLMLLLVVIPILFYVFSFHQDDRDFIGLRQKRIEDGWLIKVSPAHKAFEKGKSVFSLTMFYQIWNHSKGFVRDINGKFDED